MTLRRDWKIFRWALMHSPQECLIKLKVIDCWFDTWDYDPLTVSFSISFWTPPQIILHIPYETRRAYEIKVEGVEVSPSIDYIPF